MIFIKVILWILFLYGAMGLIIKFLKIELERNKPLIFPYALYVTIVSLVLIFLVGLITRIDPQQVGVVTTPSGVKKEALHTGWHIIAPWNEVHKMDKTVWVYTCANASKEGAKPNADAIWAPTKDGIKMGFDVSVSWRIIANDAPWIYQNVTENDGGDNGRYIWLEENIIRAKLKSSLALTVSEFTPIEAYSTKRQNIQDLTVKRIQKECMQYHIQVDNVDIREVYYNSDFEKAINNKKLAEQEALRLVDVTKQKEELLKQAEINKNIAIQQAEGEAEALKIKGSSIAKNPKIIELEWISKWSGELPTYMMGSGTNVMFAPNFKQ